MWINHRAADGRAHFPSPPGGEGGCPDLPAERLHRRSFFGRVAGGIYGAALLSLLDRDLYGDEAAHARPVHDLAPRPSHFPPRARAVIHLYMNGGPSQMDLFDPKPMLDKLHGTQHFSKIAG